MGPSSVLSRRERALASVDSGGGAEAAALALEANGCACLDGVLSPHLAGAGLAYLRSARAQAASLVKTGDLDELYAYGNVKCRAHRCDLHLSLGDPTVRRLMRAVLDKVPW
jgi:hypothetical protein